MSAGGWLVPLVMGALTAVTAALLGLVVVGAYPPPWVAAAVWLRSRRARHGRPPARMPEPIEIQDPDLPAGQRWTLMTLDCTRQQLAATDWANGQVLTSRLRVESLASDLELASTALVILGFALEAHNKHAAAGDAFRGFLAALHAAALELAPGWVMRP